MVRAQCAGRRSFLKSAAALGGAAVALALAGGKPDVPAAPAPPKPRAGRGYRLTEHVAKYYEKARG